MIVDMQVTVLLLTGGSSGGSEHDGVEPMQLELPGSEEPDEIDDADTVEDESDGGSIEGDQSEEGTGGELDDEGSGDDQATEGADFEHCPECGWCDAEQMVACEVAACGQWYHVRCLGLPKGQSDRLSDADFLWICPVCAEESDE